MGLRNVVLAGGFVTAIVVAGVFAAEKEKDAAASPGREIPAPFAPFEYLIGSWKGVASPTANKVRGWSETHAWAWKFEKGAVVGLSVTFEGGKTLAKGRISFDPETNRYQVEGTDTAGKPVTYSGSLDKTGKTLTFDRTGTTSDGAKQRLTLYPNANFVRYTLRVSEQAAGAPQFKSVIESGVTKEGESFAAGATAADLPKCIVTGGSATMTVSYQGTTYPLCCTGCRDEFNDNPEKYIKKLALLRASAGTGKSAKAAPAVNKDDGAFEGLGEETKPTPKSAGAMKKDKKPVASAEASEDAPKVATAKPSPNASSKADGILRLGQNLEKGKKTTAALDYYRRVVKEFPDTAAAKTAAARIKALTAP